MEDESSTDDMLISGDISFSKKSEIQRAQDERQRALENANQEKRRHMGEMIRIHQLWEASKKRELELQVELQKAMRRCERREKEADLLRVEFQEKIAGLERNLLEAHSHNSRLVESVAQLTTQSASAQSQLQQETVRNKSLTNRSMDLEASLRAVADNAGSKLERLSASLMSSERVLAAAAEKDAVHATQLAEVNRKAERVSEDFAEAVRQLGQKDHELQHLQGVADRVAELEEKLFHAQRQDDTVRRQTQEISLLNDVLARLKGELNEAELRAATRQTSADAQIRRTTQVLENRMERLKKNCENAAAGARRRPWTAGNERVENDDRNREEVADLLSAERAKMGAAVYEGRGFEYFSIE
jgi:hypothetical protein